MPGCGNGPPDYILDDRSIVGGIAPEYETPSTNRLKTVRLRESPAPEKVFHTANEWNRQARKYNYEDQNDAAISFLKNGLERFGLHIGLDLHLVSRYAVFEREDQLLTRYNKLLEKYESNKNKAFVFRHRSKWLLKKKKYVQSFDDLVNAVLAVPNVYLEHKFLEKITNVAENYKHEYPEYLAWIYIKFCSRERSKFDEIFELYKSSKTEALSKKRKAIIDHITDFLLTFLEVQKKSNAPRTILLANGSSDNRLLFFSRYHYEICATILLKFKECDHLTKRRVYDYLEISTDPKVIEYPFRHKRLELTKNIGPQMSEDRKNELILDLLQYARMALDSCISIVYKKRSKSHYPHAYKRITESDKQCLREKNFEKLKIDVKKLGDEEYQILCSTDLSEKIDIYVMIRVIQCWLPQNNTQTLQYETIRDSIYAAFNAFGKDKLPEQVLNSLSRREHNIITKEGAWLVIWIEYINKWKHNRHKWDIREFEKALKDFRDKTGLFEGHKEITAYDVAHMAGEFAEQTIALLLIDETTTAQM